jgi:GxxExxY protein
LDLDEITGQVIDSAIRIHTSVGPGLFESVYQTLLTKELRRRGLRVEREKVVTFELGGAVFVDGFKLDLLVEEQVAVELKSVDKLALVHKKQLLTYLRLLDLRVGLLINFGGATLIEGLQRVVNDYVPEESSRLIVNRNASKNDTPRGSA